MPSILGIDTASPMGSVALVIDGVVRGVTALPPGGHSSGLALAAERLCDEAGMKLAALGGIAVAQGPGSFTGLRIGLAWAKGVAMGASIPLAVVSSHEAAAYAESADGVGADGAAPSPGPLLLSVTPGERKQVELALWEPRAADGPDARPRAIHAPRSVPEEDMGDHIETLAAGRSFVALPANEAIAALLDEDEIPRRAPALLAPAVAVLGGLLIGAGEAADLVLAAPAYGRAPNARKPGS